MGRRPQQLRLKVEGAVVRLPLQVQPQAMEAMARLLRQVLRVDIRPALGAGERKKGKNDDA